ncbi:hypothetical protein [Chryseobacterium indologenes]|uniref:hypothetical protein n=1 Tax=Chryseobacterium indologenes TaxID=253 RepID=UPI001BCF46D7|nr:hypothetical protein [Chryseobacterium indologenes]
MITLNNSIEIKAKFNTYLKALELIREHGYTDFDDLMTVIFDEELEGFNAAVLTSEEKTIEFIINN